MNREFRSVGCREPDVLIHPRVLDIETKAVDVRAQHGSHGQRKFARKLGVDMNRLEFLLIDQGLTGPAIVVPVDGMELDLISRASFDDSFAYPFESVFLLLFASEWKEIRIKAVTRGFIVVIKNNV